MRPPPASQFLLRPFLALFLFAVALAINSCNGSCNNPPPVLVTNDMPLQVSDGFPVSGISTPNILYTSLTLCDSSATPNCQTIDKIQVDTGSSGLRIFKQALTLTLAPISNGASPVIECQTFLVNNAWGPVVTASIGLAAEPKVNLPIQVIDSTVPTPPKFSACDGGNWTAPKDPHFNGILGVSVGGPDSGLYYTCPNAVCTLFTPGASQSVVNPVLSLPADNNGVIVNLPGIPDSGQATASGDLLLGIGTSWDNDPATYSPNPIITVTLDSNDPLNAAVTADGLPFAEFAADSGTNQWLFTDPSITNCKLFGGLVVSSYCPATPKNFAALVTGTSSSQWRFQGWIRDQSALANTGNLAFNDIGSDLGVGNTFTFIAGIPFFYGKQVYFGFSGKSSSLGTGPLYAYALR